MPECYYSGEEINPTEGIMYVKNNGRDSTSLQVKT